MARPEVQEVHQVAGAHCYLIKVRSAGTRALQRFLSEHVSSQPDVLRTETIIVLETIKETSEHGLQEPATPACDGEDR